MKIIEWLQGNQHINIKIALAYLLLIIMAYSSVVFLGRTLQPILYYSVGLDGINAEVGPWSYQGRTPINTFNIDLATPAYYEWPINRLVGDFYRQGEIPIWNPYQAAGDPLAVQYSSRVFFPYQILENISPTWTWDYFILGRLWFAGFFTFLFLMGLRLSILPAFLGGIFYLFSGSFVWFINLEQMANVAMMLPFMMFALDKLVVQGNSLSIALAAIAMGLVLLAGQPEVALYVLALGGLYIGLRSLDLYGQYINRPLFGAIAAGLLALGLAAPLLLPFLEYLQHAYHMHPPSRQLGIQGTPDWRWLVAIIIPTFFDKPTFYRLGPENGLWDYLGGYIGILPLLLVFFAIFQGRSSQQKYLIFFFAVGAWILLKNIGVIPFKYLGMLPLFDQTWSPRWAGPVWVFSFAVAAALATEILWNKQRKHHTTGVSHHAIDSQQLVNKKSTQISWIISSIVIGCLVIFILFHSDVFHSALSVHDDFLNGQFQKFLSPAVFMGSAITILTIVMATVIIKYWGNSTGGLYALIALALNELWFVIPKGYPPEFLYFKLIPFFIGLIIVWECGQQRWKRALLGTSIVIFAYAGIDYMAPRGLPDQADPFSPPPYVEFLKQQAGLFRIMGGGGVLMPNFASAVGLYDVRFVSSLSVNTYYSFMSRFLRRSPAPFYYSLWFAGLSRQTNDFIPNNIAQFTQEIEKDIRAKLPFYSILGVKYFILPHSSRLQRKHVSASDFRLVYDQEVKIYENLRVLPRTFVVHQIKQVNNYQIAQTLASRRNFDFTKQAIVEERIPNISRVAYQEPTHSHAEIVRYEARNIELKVQTSRPGLVILTDVYYPGWQTEVNGQLAKIYRVNGLFRGVWLPKGEHQVVFFYWPLSYQLGFALAGLASLICLILIMISVFARKR